MELSKEEVQLILTQRKEKARITSYNQGLEAAAQQAESYAAQCCGGTGEGGEGYKNLAVSIRQLKK